MLKKRICNANAIKLLTNEKHSPKTVSQWEFDYVLSTNLPRIIVACNFFSSLFRLKGGIQLSFVYKFTRNNCPVQLFFQFIQTQKGYPASFDNSIPNMT